MLIDSLRSVPRGVVVLGFVSLLMDASSELVHALLPLFMASVLGASMFAIGIVEGIAEAAALMVRAFSGYWSDVMRKRKPLVLAGYSLGALSKFAFPLATSLGWVVGARLADRIGKGIRGAPRDALIADLAPPSARGASFGLRQALDSIGAIVGPLLAIGALAWFSNDIRAALWIAVVPAALCVLLIVFGVREPNFADRSPPSRRIAIGDLKRLDTAFVFVIVVAFVLTLARFSEAFLVLRATSVGMTLGQAPWVMVAMATVYAVFAFPAGSLADKGYSRGLLFSGLIALIASDLVLARAGNAVAVLAGAALWGLHLALTQGLMAALVAAVSPPDLRGTAFGVFNLTGGVALLLASALAGLLWDVLGPAWTFYVGAAFTLLAGVALALWQRTIPALSS